MYSIKKQDKRASADILTLPVGSWEPFPAILGVPWQHMQDVNRRNINSFHRQVQLIFEQRARILFGFVLFFLHSL